MPIIEARRVNDLQGDPAVFAYFQNHGAALLFDMGHLDRLSHRELLKVRMVLVSHAHLDHFIGFDRFLRVNIPHKRVLELVGPANFRFNVQGKLRGYLWNLIDEDQIRVLVHEVHLQGEVHSYVMSNSDQFDLHLHQTGPDPHSSSHQDGPIYLTGKHQEGEIAPPLASLTCPFGGLRIDCVVLDHKTPSLAFVCQLPRQLKVNFDVLTADGLSAGPWIKELQRLYALGARDRTIEIGGQKFPAKALGERLFTESPRKALAYVTDIGFSRTNLERLIPLIQDTQLLYCESNYRDEDAAKAKDRMHLTTKQAALIAARAKVASLEVFHISDLYSPDPTTSVLEAANFFTVFRALSADALEAEITSELNRLASL